MHASQPKKSSGSVRVRFLDAPKIIEKLRSISAGLLKENENISGIYLFGSLASNRGVPGSDADILIILKKDQRRLIDRMTEFLRRFLDAPIAIDVFPYTEDEIKTMMASGNHFVKTLWREKIVLAERQHPSSPDAG